MQRPAFLLSAIILVSTLIGCVGSATPTDLETVPPHATPTTSISLATNTSDSDLSCLSPALKMNAERAAHHRTHQ